ncbi:MAG: AraC family transcriptional regulator, partial [Myxococcaceae bacterium]|nr:AraC family transcriptional regulator [Myxococcaceae bacterium]
MLRVVEFCRVRGHDAEALARASGVSLAALAQPDARVDFSVAARLGEQALALTADPNFGLHLASDVGDAQHYDAGLLSLMASSTLRAAFERMVTMQRFWGDGDRMALVPAPEGLVVRYQLAGARGEYARHADECALAEVALGVRALTGQALFARAVRFRHPAPLELEEHREVFQCPLAFGAPHTEIEFGDAVLDTAMPHANAAFYAIFTQQVERTLERLLPPQSASEHVRGVVRAALGTPGCTLDGTARALGLSTRTLQRRLQKEGTT